MQEIRRVQECRGRHRACGGQDGATNHHHGWDRGYRVHRSTLSSRSTLRATTVCQLPDRDLTGIPVMKTYDLMTMRKVPRTGSILEAWEGINGTRPTAGVHDNKNNICGRRRVVFSI